jgi:hypothetical protein
MGYSEATIAFQRPQLVTNETKMAIIDAKWAARKGRELTYSYHCSASGTQYNSAKRERFS